MTRYRMIARVDTGADGSYLVRSPAVGVANGVPNLGVYLNPLDGFLTLRVLNRGYLIQLPRNVQGRVTETLVEDTWTPVGYDQPLFRLSQALSPEEGTGAAAGGAGAGSGVDADMIPVPSPSEGVFYRRPSPDSPAYVEEGDEITAGAVVGLVEVMKSFNQITYGGADMPERAVVAKVMAEDNAEVTFGQPLFMIRPA